MNKRSITRRGKSNRGKVPLEKIYKRHIIKKDMENKGVVIVLFVMLLISLALSVFAVLSVLAVSKNQPTANESENTPVASSSGVSGYEIVKNTVKAGTNNWVTVTSTCPTGKKVLGGGCDISASGMGAPTVDMSKPQGENAWFCHLNNLNKGVPTADFSAIAICASA